MPVFRRVLLCSSLFGLGVFVGTSGMLNLAPAAAQDEDEIELSDESVERVRAAHDALSRALDMLEGEARYSSVIQGVNAFAVSVGGIDAQADLEAGRGVDPETFAALYAGRASTDIEEHLGRDADGRLTYKGRLIRLYSEERLKSIFDARDSIIGSELEF